MSQCLLPFYSVCLWMDLIFFSLFFLKTLSYGNLKHQLFTSHLYTWLKDYWIQTSNGQYYCAPAKSISSAEGKQVYSCLVPGETHGAVLWCVKSKCEGKFHKFGRRINQRSFARSFSEADVSDIGRMSMRICFRDFVSRESFILVQIFQLQLVKQMTRISRRCIIRVTRCKWRSELRIYLHLCIDFICIGIMAKWNKRKRSDIFQSLKWQH